MRGLELKEVGNLKDLTIHQVKEHLATIKGLRKELKERDGAASSSSQDKDKVRSHEFSIFLDVELLEGGNTS